MSSKHRNLSHIEGNKLGDVSKKKFGIVCSEWNSPITGKLLDATIDTLVENRVAIKNILVDYVPGSFELTLGAQRMAERKEKPDAIICIGCVIQGETKHFDFICNSVATGLTSLTIKYNKPFVFGVLTPNNLQQAKDRSGGKHGNKGVEAAITAIKMVCN